jgi:hypothetical protein
LQVFNSDSVETPKGYDKYLMIILNKMRKKNDLLESILSTSDILREKISNLDTNEKVEILKRNLYEKLVPFGLSKEKVDNYFNGLQT